MLRQWRKWLEKNSIGNQIFLNLPFFNHPSITTKNDKSFFIQFLTIRQSSIHPFFASHTDTDVIITSIRSPKSVFVVSYAHLVDRYLPWGGGITSVGSRRFGTSISGGLRFGCAKKFEACMFWVTSFFVATLAAKQKKQWLRQKTRFLFEAGCFWWIPWFEQQHVQNPQSKKKHGRNI